jgi:hypothetical protein
MRWTESIAVGNERFVKEVKERLGVNTIWREIAGGIGSFDLRESMTAYAAVFDPENDDVRQEKALFGDMPV